MQISLAASLETIFRSENEVGVNFTWEPLENTDQSFLTLLTFSLFWSRQMVNLGRGPVADSVAHLLANTNPIQLGELGESGRAGELRLVSGIDPKHARSFEGNVGGRLSVDTGDMRALPMGNLQFRFKARRFGWLGRGIGYYAPASVLASLCFVSRLHVDDESFLKALSLTAGMLGIRYLGGGLSLGNYREVALGIAWIQSRCYESEAFREMWYGDSFEGTP